MIFNQVVIGNHPATSGYKLDFFVNGFDSTFASGSGQYTVGFPGFGVSGLGFRGKNAIFDTGVAFLSNVDIFEGEVRISGFLSGDFNNSGILNVKNIDIYTGASASFACDTINHSNRIITERVSIENTEDPFIIDVVSGDITGANGLPRFDEDIFYKAVPGDFLIGRNQSDAVSGAMLGELPTISVISGIESFLVQRHTATDLFIETADNGVEIFPFIDRRSVASSRTDIVIGTGVPIDFVGEFTIKNDGRAGFVRFSEEGGLKLSVSKTLTKQDGIFKVGQTLMIDNVENEDRGFTVGFEVNANGEKTRLGIEATA
jgi:hypothetical protein